MPSLIHKVYSFIEKNKLIKKKSNILIALSGGPDSVFLAYALAQINKKYNLNLNINACYINHQLRKQTINEIKFNKNLCSKLNIKFFVRTIPEKQIKKNNIENNLRNLRYKKLIDVCIKNKITYLLTAHHYDDNIETIILNLLRFSSLTPVNSIPIKRMQNSIKIIRPLINIKKQEILKFLRDRKIDYCIDETNKKTDFFRNFIRLKILPEVYKKNKKIKTDLIKLSYNSALIFNKLNNNRQILKTVILKKNKDNIICLKIDNNFYKYKNVILYLIDKIIYKKTNKKLPIKQIENIYKLYKSKSGKKINLSYGLIGVKDFGILKIYNKNLIINQNQDIYIKKKLKKKINVFIAQIDKNIKIEVLKREKNNIIIRNPNYGDYIFLNKKKIKLKNIFLEKKISIIDRWQKSIVFEIESKIEAVYYKHKWLYRNNNEFKFCIER